MKRKYMKIYVDHFDPVSGLRWFSAERVPAKKRRIDITKLPGIMLGIFAAMYLVMWLYWAWTVALPALIQ